MALLIASSLAVQFGCGGSETASTDEGPGPFATEQYALTSNGGIVSVAASSAEAGYPAASAADASYATRWSTYGHGQWIAADLGTVQSVQGLQVAWYRGSYRQYYFTIGVSTDGARYTNVYSGTSSGTTLRFEQYAIPATSARFVKLTVNGNSKNSWDSVTEVAVTLAPGSTPPPLPLAVAVTPQATTLAAGASAQFSAGITGTTNTTVSWTVQEGAAGGSLTSTGWYTAPASAGTYHVVATSQADGGKSSSSTVTVSAASPSPSPSPTSTSTPSPTQASGSPSFTLMSEMYGDAGATAQQRASQGLLNGATFHPALTSSEQQFVTSSRGAVAYFAVPAEANIQSCYPSSADSDADALLTSLTKQLGSQVWRLGMPEFDQGGGCWASGRPSTAGLSDAQAYSSWTGFYLDTKQLRPYLNQTAAQRGYKWMSVCSFAFCPQYAFDMGSDAVLLERNEDEMSGITPGLAMIRGAAAQHGGKEWGIDFSTWRYWNNGPTVYSNGRLVTGWSTSTFKRNMYISYMGGANIIHNEAAEYTAGAAAGQSLNPLGLAVQDFHGFAVTRHPDRGTPYVPMTLMQEHNSGLEPKFGEWMQGGSKWYWTNAYSLGDRMFSNLLSVAYPGYNAWGTLPSGAPKVLNADGSIDISGTFTAYRQALVNGRDPRPWEPLGSSRWGESFDVITNQAPLAAMQRYKAVVLATGAPMSDALLAGLTQYVQQGGILVVNAKQLSASAETLTGLHLTTGRATASSVSWTPDGSTLGESAYNYTLGTRTTATVIAQTAGNPIITRNAVGLGAVYVTTADFMSDSAGNILAVGQKLIDTIQSQLAVVSVSGPQLEYLVNTDGNRIIVTLVNTSLAGAAWSGTLAFNQPASAFTVKEWVGDTTVASSVQSGRVMVNASVPAYDVRVYVLDAP